MAPGLLYAIGMALIDLPWYALGCAPFLERARVKKGTLVCLGLLIELLRAGTGGLIVTFAEHWSLLISIHHLVSSMCLLLAYHVIFDTKVARCLYTLLLVQALATVINFLALGIYTMAFPEETVNMSTSFGYTLSILAGNLALFPFLWRFFRGTLRQAFAMLSGKSIRQLCVPPLLFYALLQASLMVSRMSGVSNLGVSVLTLAILATGLATYYMHLGTAWDSARHVRKESEMEKQLAFQAQGYENLTQSIQAARAARHDLHFHFNAIGDFARREDKEGLLAYLQGYRESLPLEHGVDWCENRPVNAVLEHYLGKALEGGAALDIKLDLPQKTGIADADLCVVFGNVFENASSSVTALGKGSVIHARCVEMDGDLVLTVENSVGEAAQAGQGLGLSNVKAVAGKYGGLAQFEEKDGLFCSKVILRPREGATAQEEGTI